MLTYEGVMDNDACEMINNNKDVSWYMMVHAYI